MVNRRTAAVLGIFALLLLAAVGPLSFADLTATCDWSTLEIEGETFTSIDDLKQAAAANGVEYAELNDVFDFRVSDGVVEYRSPDCGVQEVSTPQ